MTLTWAISSGAMMPLTDWIFAKREEARKLHLANYRAWIEAGCVPVPVYGR